MLLYMLILPVLCLVVVWYEIGFLQSVDRHSTTASSVQMLDEAKPLLRKASSIRGRKTMVLIANYRDSKRCAETLESLFSNAVEPDLLSIGVFDQIYSDEPRCVDAYCDLVGASTCRRHQVANHTADAASAKGPTVARYETEKLIGDQDFCLAIDSHLRFIKNWDDELIQQYDATGNPNAIITVYPKSTQYMDRPDVNKHVQLMCVSQIESKEVDAMIQYGAPEYVKPGKTPRLQSQLAGGFNFGTCAQAKEVRNDPYTPYLFHGEEYSRAARLWTSGYDFYAPSKDICFHWYEPRKVVWERDWGTRFVIQQRSRRRIRHVLGLPISKQDVDMTEIESFGLGKKRSFEQWKKFSKIDPLAPFDEATERQFENCGPLELVPYNN